MGLLFVGFPGLGLFLNPEFRQCLTPFRNAQVVCEPGKPSCFTDGPSCKRDDETCTWRRRHATVLPAHSHAHPVSADIHIVCGPPEYLVDTELQHKVGNPNFVMECPTPGQHIMLGLKGQIRCAACSCPPVVLYTQSLNVLKYCCDAVIAPETTMGVAWTPIERPVRRASAIAPTCRATPMATTKHGSACIALRSLLAPLRSWMTPRAMPRRALSALTACGRSGRSTGTTRRPTHSTATTTTGAASALWLAGRAIPRRTLHGAKH